MCQSWTELGFRSFMVDAEVKILQKLYMVFWIYFEKIWSKYVHPLCILTYSVFPLSCLKVSSGTIFRSSYRRGEISIYGRYIINILSSLSPWINNLTYSYIYFLIGEGITDLKIKSSVVCWNSWDPPAVMFTLDRKLRT